MPLEYIHVLMYAESWSFNDFFQVSEGQAHKLEAMGWISCKGKKQWAGSAVEAGNNGLDQLLKQETMGWISCLSRKNGLDQLL